MNRGETIFLDHSLGYENRILKVVSVPWHEGDSHILTERQLTEIHRGSVSKNVTALNRVARANNRALIDTGVLVRTLVLGQVINIDRRFVLSHLRRIDTNNDSARVNRVNDTAACCHFTDARIAGHVTLHTRAH